VAEVTKKLASGGLAGITASESAICLCGAEEESLLYRGYNVEELAEHATFEEVAYLLTRGKKPTEQELQEYLDALSEHRQLPDALKETLEKLPKETNRMDLLRTGVSLLGNLEPEETEGTAKSIDRLISTLPSILLYWFKFHFEGKRINFHSVEKSLAGYFLTKLHDRAVSELERRALDVSLILYAEHEFNASTFTVRVIASTLSDYFSAITGGIGSLRGPLHGGANEKAMDLISSFNTPDEAEAGVLEMLSRKQLIMGFGHRVYTTKDPRSDIIKVYAKNLASETGEHTLFPIAERIDEVMKREKNLFPNLDFYSALVYHYLNLPVSFFTPLFVFSRVSGWSAHYKEQKENNKLIRPLSKYVGPPPRRWID